MGPPYIMHREDMETVAPLWYHFTKEVRNDPGVRCFPDSGASIRLHCSVAFPALLCPVLCSVHVICLVYNGSCLSCSMRCLQAWNLTGDGSVHRPGEKSWISEMYG